MDRHQSTETRQNGKPASGAGSWNQRYGLEHKLRRFHDFPQGILPPKKVRIYRRRDHFLLQWWDPGEKRTLNVRVEGDLVTAIAQAREIDHRLTHFKSVNTTPRHVRHEPLVNGYVGYLRQRANAGEIDVATACRYESALRHFLDFTQHSGLAPAQRYIAGIDREFQLQFTSYLNNLRVAAKGQDGVGFRPLQGQAFVLDVVRSMLAWAADPERGNLLPDGFRNPFSQRVRSTQRVARDPLKPLDISTKMATELVQVADRFQLTIFAPLLIYGLRPGELGWLFAEHVQAGWLSIPNILELEYTTKGRRDKRFPLVPCLANLWNLENRVATGLIYSHRAAVAGHSKPPLAGWSLSGLTTELRKRYGAADSGGASQRRQVRNQLMKDAGHLSYDHIEGEFQQLARRLRWPVAATLKDFRHLFATCLQNTGMPEFYRRYLMGHAFGNAPIITYTHLTEEKVLEHYQRALATELSPLLMAIQGRVAELGVRLQS